MIAETLADAPSTSDPVVLVTARWTGKVWSLEFFCPWCRGRRKHARKHYHGGGDGLEPFAGHRVSHCLGETAPDGYWLLIDRIER